MKNMTKEQECLKKLTVLYVEDEEDTRQQFSRFLSRLTGELIVAENGAQGLAAFQKNRPQIVITDVLMPVMDGLTMAREIRRLDESVDFIALTAFDQADYIGKFVEIGVDKYLTKPVDGVKLLEMLLECAGKLSRRGYGAR